MRLSRFVLLSLGTAAMVACGGADVTTPSIPPLASVRFINALSDTGSVDVRAIDQVANSPVANNLAYRAATTYQNAAVGVRHFRVFPTSTNINVTSQVMVDVSVTFLEGSRLTLLVAGSARAGTVGLYVINDATQPPPSGQIGIRMVNTATGQVNGYVSAAPTDPLGGSPTFSSVLALAPTAYVNKATGAAALQVTDVGSSSVNAAAAGPAAATTLPGELPAAGVTSAGTVFSAYYFPASLSGSTAPQTPAFQVPAIIWFVDRNPCDVPAVPACTL